MPIVSLLIYEYLWLGRSVFGIIGEDISCWKELIHPEMFFPTKQKSLLLEELPGGFADFFSFPTSSETF